MHKRKDGKIIASLTEVKNKTGDIFSLVDEFGEVTLTSYNKPKYRITKVSISETLDIKDAPEKTTASSPKKAMMQKEETGMISAETMDKLKKMKTWDRNSRKEKSFIANSKLPLQ